MFTIGTQAGYSTYSEVARQIETNSRRRWRNSGKALNGVLNPAWLSAWAYLDSYDLNLSNRPARTRMPGSVAGGNPYELSPRGGIHNSVSPSKAPIRQPAAFRFGMGRGLPASSMATNVMVASVTLTGGSSMHVRRRANTATSIVIEVVPTLMIWP